LFQSILCAVSGALMTCAFAPYYITAVAFLSFSVLFALLLVAENKKQLFMLGCVFGFAEGAFSMFWIRNALLIDGGRFIAFLPLVVLGFGLFFGVFSGISALFIRLGRTPFIKLLSFAVGWTACELIRGWIFTGFPWNLLGYVWGECLPVLQSVSVWGVYGLSFVSVLLFCLPVLLVYKDKKSAFLILVFWGIILLLGLLRLNEDENAMFFGIKLRLVQPNIAQTLKWDEDSAEKNLYKHIRMSRNKAEDKITHVIWPEAATAFLLADDEPIRSLTIGALRQGQVLLSGSLRRSDEKHLANSVVVIDDVGGFRGSYDKSHLVPFGEYVPLRGILPLEKIVPISADFKAGSGPKTLKIPNAPSVGMLVCYEILFSGQVVDSKKRPSWLLNVTNDAWYGMSAGPHQHFVTARFRAVEEGLSVVRSANNGISAVINPYGKIISRLDLGEEGVLDSELPRPIRTTIYGRFGVFVVVFLLGGIFCGVLVHFFRKNSGGYFIREKEKVT